MTHRICRCLALENLADIGKYMHADVTHERGLEWYTLFFAFQSCLTLLLSVVWEPGALDAVLWREVGGGRQATRRIICG
jgi:hypothetical protein